VRAHEHGFRGLAREQAERRQIADRVAAHRGGERRAERDPGVHQPRPGEGPAELADERRAEDQAEARDAHLAETVENGGDAEGGGSTSGGSTGTPAPYREGFAVNILNPSITSFYVGVTPTFVAPGSGWRALAFLYAAHIAIVFGCHVFWSSVFSQARTFFAGERPRRWLDAAIGVILLWLAYRIGVSRT